MIPRDPLAGQRQAINDEDQHALMWPDVGQGCPVEVGQIIPLRSCHIEITRTHRVQPKGKPWQWRAEFRRIYPHRELYLLDRKGEYTNDPDQALHAQDDPDAATIDSIDEDDRSEEHRNAGEPPEPEAVPPYEIPKYSGSIVARQNYELEQSRRRAELRELPVAQRLAALKSEADANHIDISSEMRVIERRLAAIERKVNDRAA